MKKKNTASEYDRARLDEIDDLADASFGIRPFEHYPGKITCPCCGRTYKPKYRHKDKAPVGTIFMEQHLSGICSDACWDKMTLPGGSRR